MGRKKIDENKKKVRLAVSLDPDLTEIFKNKSINLSSLVNKLLRKYVNDGYQSL